MGGGFLRAYKVYPDGREECIRGARLTGLTVKALRHYDELGLLPPAAVDRRLSTA